MPTVTVTTGSLESLLAEQREIELAEFIADCKRAARRLREAESEQS
jgi:hypothetical protein